MRKQIKRLIVPFYEWGHLLSRPSHWRLFAATRGLYPAQSDAVHLRAALDWLCRAHDASAGNGVSAGYFFRRGWMPPYPETTGYIIPTLLAAAEPENDYAQRALRLGDWEIDIQLPSGAVRGGIGLNDYPVVFNSGQVILGWTALYRHTREKRFLQAAQRAADWLVSIQDEDGKWSRHTYLNAPRAYHTRVAWPLLEVHSLSGKTGYQQAATRFLNWLLPQQSNCGFFPFMALEPGATPITHTIAYTLRGLIECARLLPDSAIGDDAMTAARHSSQQLLDAQATNVQAGTLPAALDENWQGNAAHSCLTGNAQLAIVFLTLRKDNRQLAQAAYALIERLKGHQPLHSGNPGIRGGLPSSSPIWGPYVPCAILNWATKFFVDALVLQGEVQVNSTSANSPQL